MYENEDEIRNRHPLHYLVWRNEFDELKKYIKRHPNVGVETLDPTGRTPLMLAVTLDHKKCAKILMNNNALVNVTDNSGFNVLHEAVTSQDKEFIFDVCQQKHSQNHSLIRGIPSMLAKMAETSDFYVEMKWDFTSWLPMIGNFCPNDSYKIYKSGSKLRIDFSLTGINSSGGIGGTPKWVKGNKSYIFLRDGDGGTFIDVDHDKKQICEDIFQMGVPDNESYVFSGQYEVDRRLSKPIETVFLNTEDITFERARKGLFFTSDRSETIEGFSCDVYNSINAQVIQKARIEHLEDQESAKSGLVRSSVGHFLGLDEKIIPNQFKGEEVENVRNPHNLSMLDYFNQTDPEKDIGISRELIIKSFKLQASLWMSGEYPLSLSEQILPILNLLAMTSSHYARLRDFIQAKIPQGFPVQIEIPLFHFLTAHITFRNVLGMSEPVEGVTTTMTADDENPAESKAKCVIDPSLFVPCPTYERLANEFNRFNNFGSDGEDDQHNDEEDDLQKVLEMSLKELQRVQQQVPQQQKSTAAKADLQKQQSEPEVGDEFQDALDDMPMSPTSHSSSDSSSDERKLQKALEQSKAEHEAEQQKRRAEEEAEIERAIQKSLLEK